ncbi:MAG: PhnD/SsuA/transferrin family substrate-binding protein [Rhodobacteraceae bacterium]|nr:PhnD/SsuA/transferrin family substrate-binding protein [Paracoccaceae bacterium]
MIASLPMYDRAEVQGATDRFWQAIRDDLGDAPDHLCRTGDIWDHWRAPDLVLSQTCGYPYRARLHGQVHLVGTPDYGLEGCGPGQYCSVFVARVDDARSDPCEFVDTVFAYNEPLSQSGWAAPAQYAATRGYRFGTLLRTGGHALSARAVSEGRADLAALDALSWRMIRAHDPFAENLREIARTDPTPALPYITSASRDPAPLFAAITRAIDALSPQDRAALSLHGIVAIPAEAYLAVPNPPPPPEGA